MSAPGPRRLQSVVAASVATAIGLAVLISLGLWQMERLAWKEALVAAMHERLTALPADLPGPAAWPSLTAENAEFRRVRLRVDFPDLPRALVYAGAPALRTDIRGPGYFVFAPARLPAGETVVVNAGWVPADRQYQWTGGAREITGYLRWPEKPGLFVSEHDAAGDIWFARDPAAMARVRGWGPVAPFYIDQEGPAAAAGAPRPGPLTVNLRNNHLGYAWTWFGLAGALAGVFAFWLYFSRRRTVNAGANPSL
jgi:cytochrome oxidase assembly protein ShyY1